MNEVDVKSRKIGVNFNERKEAEITVWAPEAEQVEISSGNKKIPLLKQQLGFWNLKTADIKPGALYKFILNGEKEWPDPASLAQPEGVHGFSQAVEIKDFDWADHAWKNLPLDQY